MGNCCAQKQKRVALKRKTTAGQVVHSQVCLSSERVEEAKGNKSGFLASISLELQTSKYEFSELNKPDNLLSGSIRKSATEKLSFQKSSDLDEEDEVSTPLFPLRFQEKRPEARFCPVPKLSFSEKALNYIAEREDASKKEEEEKDVPASFTLRAAQATPASQKPSDKAESLESEESQEISESNLSSDSQESPKLLETGSRAVLRPVQVKSGRSLLLQPLYQKADDALSQRHVKECRRDSMIGRSSTQATNQPNSLSQKAKLNKSSVLLGNVKYSIIGEVRELQGNLGCRVYLGKSGDEEYYIYRYSKKKAKRVILGRGYSGLNVLLSQIAIMSKASHPNLAEFSESIDCASQLYLVLKMDSVLPLSSLIPLDEETAWDVFRQMLSGVDYLHTVLKARSLALTVSSFVVTGSGRVLLSWLSPIVPLGLNDSQGGDLLALLGILFILLYGDSDPSETGFELILEMLKSGASLELISHSSLRTSQIESLYRFAQTRQVNMTSSELLLQPWVSTKPT